MAANLALSACAQAALLEFEKKLGGAAPPEYGLMASDLCRHLPASFVAKAMLTHSKVAELERRLRDELADPEFVLSLELRSFAFEKLSGSASLQRVKDQIKGKLAGAKSFGRTAERPRRG
jgi:hypothetical protein